MPAADGPFRDAEAWLAERGVRREPIRVAPAHADQDAPVPPAAGPPTEVEDARAGAAGAPGEVRAREATRLAAQADADRQLAAAERAAAPSAALEQSLEDEVARAVAFIRRSTGSAPQAEGRLRDKLSDREHSPRAIDLALEQARRERLVDDAAMAGALVEEKRRAGHAPARIRRDLRERGFDDEVLDPALAAAESEDQEAAAFAVAVERASRLTAAPSDTAFRRVHGHVVRRGYPDALARKVARQAVFTTRDQERAAGH